MLGDNHKIIVWTFCSYLYLLHIASIKAIAQTPQGPHSSVSVFNLTGYVILLIWAIIRAFFASQVHFSLFLKSSILVGVKN